MKFNIKILLLILILINCTSYSQNKTLNLFGNWEITDYLENKSDFTLSVDNYVSMSINEEFIDGKNFIIRGGKYNGRKGELKYIIKIIHQVAYI